MSNNRRKAGVIIAWVGTALMLLGFLTMAGIFLVIVFNGRWPAAFKPLRDIVSGAAGWLGDATFLLWLAAFLGPGFALYSLGTHISSDRR